MDILTVKRLAEELLLAIDDAIAAAQALSQAWCELTEGGKDRIADVISLSNSYAHVEHFIKEVLDEYQE